MAQTSIVPADILLARRVQEMVLNGEEPPPPYICRDDGPTQVVSSTLCSIPIIDFGLLSSPAPDIAQQKQELDKLRLALSSWGCFQAVNHGISVSFLNEVRQVGRDFFQQPMEEKNKVCKGVEEFDGYGADPVPEEGQSLDWSDRLFLYLYPQDTRKYTFWPTNPPSFRGVLEEYGRKIMEVTDLVSRGMARSLNLEEKCFVNQIGEEATLQARFNYYSRCEWPDLVLGLKPHADSTAFTIILQDDVEGLQIHQDGKWFTVPTIQNALLVLVGDLMEMMSNGVFKSPVHRVLTNSERDRLSVAMFYQPALSREIGPEEGLVSEEQPRLFKKVKDYPTIHWDFYQRGMRALHVARV
ncbi:protein SRG1-like [Prosopis cineraria]|uniref:protein SRG1-like n=1 Tax=Prosopis cineraria TaxID=364024 RepID=UPI0024100EDA|nr:protein SRG1-like [Prosopis cineraria]